MRKSLWITLILLALLNLGIWSAVLKSQENKLELTVLDVGQGDALFIETPHGTQILIDGGPDTQVLKELSRVMPFWDRSLDVVMLTHGDKDHIGGIPEVLRRFKVEHIITTTTEADTAFFDVFKERMKREEAIHMQAKRGQVVNFGDGVVLTILFPDHSEQGRDINNTSIVARLDYKNTSVLLTGDIEAQVEEYLLSLDGGTGLLDTDVLKVAHHGSKSSSALPFISAVTPAIALISAGDDNSYGHPHRESLENLGHFTDQVLCTCEKGRVTLVSDGEKIEIH